MRLWQVWIVVILVASGPWFGVTATPQWSRVTWLPFTGDEDKPTDVLVNLLLFAPLGWSLARERKLSHAIAIGCAVSVLAESMQLFCLRRDPSATDILMNTIGTAAGVAARRLQATAD